MKNQNIKWHRETLPGNAEEVLAKVSSLINSFHFYLGGGTGLALILGHRKSDDFDFFNLDLFDEEILLQHLQGLEGLSLNAKDKSTLHFFLHDIKISFLGYNYPLLFKKKKFDIEKSFSFEVADERDIACMKISAISSRGSKRDFIDLYSVAEHFGLPELFALFRKKFSLTPYNNLHVFKSLTYFEDADREPMPEMLLQVSWESVKKFFIFETTKLTHKYF